MWRFNRLTELLNKNAEAVVAFGSGNYHGG
jgi:hypothetical protein